MMNVWHGHLVFERRKKNVQEEKRTMFDMNGSIVCSTTKEKNDTIKEKKLGFSITGVCLLCTIWDDVKLHIWSKFTFKI